MSDSWFTSDHHFFHKKIIKYCARSRPFDTIEEMNEGLIERWNERVKPGDDVYHLGDFSFGTHEKTAAILSRLKGNIHLILGNHDRAFQSGLIHSLTEVTTYKELPTKKFGVPIVLCHFPIESWHRRDYQSIHVHGHLHSTSGHHPCTQMANRLDVGVDAHPECAPWSSVAIKKALHESS